MHSMKKVHGLLFYAIKLASGSNPFHTCFRAYIQKQCKIGFESLKTER